jgi:hypothetical protein
MGEGVCGSTLPEAIGAAFPREAHIEKVLQCEERAARVWVHV